MHWWPFPALGDRGSHKKRCYSGPCSHWQGEADEPGEAWLGCSDHKMIEFKILKVSECEASLLQRTSSSSGICLTECHGIKPWRQERPKNAAFKDHFLQVQKQCIPRKKAAGKSARRLTWMNKMLLDLFGLKRRVYKQWKWERVMWEDYREIIQAASDQVRKAKAQIELNLSGEIKGTKNFFTYINEKKERLGKMLDLSERKMETW